jgi:prolyl 4-hydroxylase
VSTFFYFFQSIPLVFSAIINVAQDVDEDWILEVIGHDGYAMNLTMNPGDMILYESHSIIHGRPYPLRGNLYGNCYIHFEPIGYSNDFLIAPQHRNSIGVQTTKDKYEVALATQMAEKIALVQSEDTTEDNRRNTVMKDLPNDIRDDTIEARRWRQDFDFVRVHIKNEINEENFPMILQRKPKTLGATSAHVLAAKNDIVRIREVARTDPTSLDTADINGWKPIHEAARGGSTQVLKFLVEEYGVDVNERTNGGSGGSPLWWAEKELPEGHEIIALLRKRGGIAIAPFQEDHTKEQD